MSMYRPMLGAAFLAAGLHLPATASPVSSIGLSTAGASALDTLALAADTDGARNPLAPGDDFLAHALGAVGPGAPDTPATSFVQSGPAERNPLSVNLRGDSDLVLWNLVAMLHAQKVGESFDLVDTVAASLQPSPLVATVPLPLPAWLLIVGLLGLAGTRITGLRADTAAMAEEPSAAAPANGVARA